MSFLYILITLFLLSCLTLPTLCKNEDKTSKISFRPCHIIRNISVTALNWSKTAPWRPSIDWSRFPRLQTSSSSSCDVPCVTWWPVQTTTLSGTNGQAAQTCGQVWKKTLCAQLIKSTQLKILPSQVANCAAKSTTCNFFLGVGEKGETAVSRPNFFFFNLFTAWSCSFGLLEYSVPTTSPTIYLYRSVGLATPASLMFSGTGWRGGVG